MDFQESTGEARAIHGIGKGHWKGSVLDFGLVKDCYGDELGQSIVDVRSRRLYFSKGSTLS